MGTYKAFLEAKKHFDSLSYVDQLKRREVFEKYVTPIEEKRVLIEIEIKNIWKC